MDNEAPRYYCSITTLNESGSETEYQHQSTIYYFPDDIIDQSDEKTAVWSFVVTEESGAISEGNWNIGDYKNVVRTAVCNLPDVEDIEQEVGNRLSIFDDESWLVQISGDTEVHATLQEEISILGDPLPVPDPIEDEGCGWYCNYYWITTVAVGGEIVSVTVECDSNAWSRECNVGDSGGSGLPAPPATNPGGGGGGPGGGVAEVIRGFPMLLIHVSIC